MDADRTSTAPRILGLTGSIACGKTTVGDILLELGARERIDADRVVHELMQGGGPVVAAIRSAFGVQVIASDGSVDRALLGRVVFTDPEALHTLEAIVHPAVRTAIRDRIRSLSGGNGVIVIDAVKLLQSDLLELVNTVWVVRCNRQEQTARLTHIRGMTSTEAAARLSAQPQFEHAKVSRVIDNSGSLEHLRSQVTDAWTDFIHHPPDSYPT